MTPAGELLAVDAAKRFPALRRMFGAVPEHEPVTA
jgi:hypothetical protein